ncbi:MAG: PIN domain-containing protein [Deltaproteobacteria bacterium]|nr:PIN domain-containing protein [Deltaproteobacteria bacterium]
MASSVLIDTHVLIWVLTKSGKLKGLPWIDRFSVLTVSPISLLEIRLLREIRRLSVDFTEILANLKQDERFCIDNASLDELCATAYDLSWTRDPFDRLLVAHSIVSDLPFGTEDVKIREHYSNVL